MSCYIISGVFFVCSLYPFDSSISDFIAKYNIMAHNLLSHSFLVGRHFVILKQSMCALI